MGKEVWLTVTGEQKDADGRRDRSSTQCRARYEKEGDLHVFEYRERGDGGEIIRSRLVFSGRQCRIEREGAVRTVMCFRPDEETEAEYETGFGSIPMKIFTRRLAMKEIGDNIHARVTYNLRLGGGDPVECAVTIKAEPAE